MLYIDSKYAGMLSPRVKLFRQVKDYTWNFACPICGDLSKGKQKTRGYVYKAPGVGTLNYKCHHCGASMSLGSFLKMTQPDLYKEYVFDNYQETNKIRVPHSNITSFANTKAVTVAETVLSDSSLEGLKSCANLPESNVVYKYLSRRQIPKDKWNLIYYTTKFKEYTNKLLPEKFKSLDDDHPRLIFPYFNNHGKMFAYSARAFSDKRQPKYYTIKLDESERIYGFERVDSSKRIYAVEGPIDSLFLPNTIAVSGSSFDTPTLQSLKSTLTVISDNEPRSREIVKIVKKNIDMGYSVCMLPHTVEHKDINEMILSGMTSESIVELIDKNTFQGPQAQLKFIEWKLV